MLFPNRVFICLILSQIIMSGCITYSNFPKPIVETPKPSKGPAISYRIVGTTIFWGDRMLEQMLVAKSPFASVKPSQDISPKGFFLEINIRNKPPRPSAKIFRYVTLATLTAIPAVSTRDGYIVYFDWYRYGKKERTFEYKVYRESFVWAPMIPFSWVNAFTYHESEAFAGVIQQFFKDVSEYLESRKANSK